MDEFCKKHASFQEKIQLELSKIARYSRKRILLANVSKYQEFEYDGPNNKTNKSIISTMPNARGLSKYATRVERQLFESFNKFDSFNYLCTPTTDTSQFCCPIGAWEWISGNWNRLREWLKRQIPEFLYFGVVEATKRGYPHMHILCKARWLSRAELAKLRSKWGARIEWSKIRDSIATSLSYITKYVLKDLLNVDFMALLRALKKRQYFYSRGLLKPLSTIGKSNDTWEYIHTLNHDELLNLIQHGKLIAVKKGSHSSVPPLEKYYVGEHKEWILFHKPGE